MKFNDLLSKLKSLVPRKKITENFFSLNIDLDTVTAAVWTINQNRLVILNTARATYQNGDDFKSDKSILSFIDAANYSLDAALANITPEPTKLLFGVPDVWLEDDDIKAEYLKILRRTVKELGVEPMAYVSITHAISHLLQKQQGVPLSAVLVEASDPVIVSVIKAGQNLGSKVQTYGGDIGKDVEDALSGFTGIEVLPARILVYGGQDPTRAREELSSYRWGGQLPFLHLPRAEALEDLVDIRAVAFAGGSELVPELHPEISLLPRGADTKLSRPLPDETEEMPEGSANEAGFVEGDIKKRPPRVAEPESQGYPGSEEEADIIEQEEWVDGRRPGSEAGQEGVSLASRVQALITAPLMAMADGTPQVNRLPRLLARKMVIIPVTVLVGLTAAYIFIPSAKVAVFVDMQPLTNSAQIIADPSITAVDQENNKIPGKLIETDVSGSGSIATTGKKKVGDPARGKVVIYNATTNPVNLNRGTVLTAGSGLKFTLDEDVKVASKSANASDPPSRSDVVGATASDIGPEGNIAAGTDLTVAGFSQAQVEAKVDTAFSGGVSKDVAVVTADDQNRLLAQVTSELKQKAQPQLQSQPSGDLKILPEALLETITRKSFTKNIGDQADSLTVSVTAHYKTTAFSDADLKSLAGKLIQTQVPDPSKYSIDNSQAQVDAEVTKVDKNGLVYFNARFKSKLMPKLDIGRLKDEISGKTPSQARQILKAAEPSIIDVLIKVSPPLPGPLDRLPLRKENISIDVTAK